MTQVIDQIQALLNKTVENGCTDAEAAAAAAIAQKLLTKHRLTMADIAETGTEVSSFDFGEHFTDTGLESGNRIAQWKLNLMHIICETNGCHSIVRSHWISRGRRRDKKNHILIVIGEEKDAVLVSAFYKYLRDVVEKMAKKAKPEGLARGEGKSWSNSYKIGVVNAIRVRMKVAHQEVKHEASTTALVRLDSQDDALSQWIQNKYDNKLKTRQTSKSNINHEAYEKGKQDGKEMSLETNVIGG